MKIIWALALAAIAGSAFAGTGVTYQTVDCIPCQQQVVQQQYQTITINEPRVKWTPTVEYVERQVQVAVPTVQLSSSVPTVVTQCVPQQTLSVPSVGIQSTPMQVVQQPVCPNGQCQLGVAETRTVPTIDWDYSPAVIGANGNERIIKTPLRAAIATRRMIKTANFQ